MVGDRGFFRVAGVGGQEPFLHSWPTVFVVAIIISTVQDLLMRNSILPCILPYLRALDRTNLALSKKSLSESHSILPFPNIEHFLCLPGADLMWYS